MSAAALDVPTRPLHVQTFLAFDFGTSASAWPSGNTPAAHARTPLRHDRGRRAMRASPRSAALIARMAARRAGGRRAVPSRRRARTKYRARARFARQLHGRFGLPVYEVDERYSTTEPWPPARRDADAGAACDHPGTILEESALTMSTPRRPRCRSAVPRPACAACSSLLQARHARWSASLPAAPGWPSGCSSDLDLPASPASSRRPCTATTSPSAACPAPASRRSCRSTSTARTILLSTTCSTPAAPSAPCSTNCSTTAGRPA